MSKTQSIHVRHRSSTRPTRLEWTVFACVPHTKTKGYQDTLSTDTGKTLCRLCSDNRVNDTYIRPMHFLLKSH